MINSGQKFISKFKLILIVSILAVSFSPPAVKAGSLFDATIELVRAPGSDRIFALVDGKRYLFRSPKILESYAYRSKKVKKITAEALGALSSVKLIKSSLGPRVYLIDEKTGQKLWYPTERSFLDSGQKWSDIVHVSGVDSRFYRNAHLVKTADNSKVYYLDLDVVTRSPIRSPEDFLKAGFKWQDIIVASQALVESYALADEFDPDNVVFPPEDSTDKPTLQITLGGDNRAQVFPAGTSRNKVMGIVLQAQGGTVSVESIAVTRKGFLQDIDIAGISLLDEEGVLMTRPQRFVDGVADFEFSEPLIVAVGGSRRLSFAVSFSRSTEITGQVPFSLAIMSAKDIVSNGQLEINFPLEGVSHTVLSTAQLIGILTVDSKELSGAIREATVGTRDQEFNKFTFTAGDNEDIFLERIIFTHIGSAKVNDFSNFELVNENNRIVARASADTQKTIRMNFIKDYRLPKGESQDFILRADIVSGAGRTSQFIIKNDFDVYATGESFGFAIMPLAGPVETNFPVGNRQRSDFNTIHIEYGEVLLSLASASPASPITKGANEAVLAIFEFRSSGQEFAWQKVDLEIKTTAPHTPLAGSVKIGGPRGEVLGSIDAVNVLNQKKTLYLSSSVKLSPNRTYTFEVIADISENATVEDSYQVRLSNAQFSISGTSDRVESSEVVSGAVRTVREVTLLVRNDSRFDESTAVAGRTRAKVASLLLKASAGETIRVEEIVLESIGGSEVSFGQGFSNLKLGRSNIASPSGGLYRFSLNSKIRAGGESRFDLIVDSTATTHGATVQFRVKEVFAFGDDSGARIAVSFDNLETPLIEFKKTLLTISSDPNFNGGAVTKGQAVVVSSFVVTASGAEDISLDAFIITEATGSSGLSVVRGYKNLKLVEASSGRTKSSTAKTPVGGVGGDRLTRGPRLSPGESITLNVVVDAEEVADGDIIQLVISNIEGRGRSSRILSEIAGIPVVGQVVTF